MSATPTDTGATPAEKTFLGHPRGLATLFNVELWERFSYYGMRAILLYSLVDTAANGGLGLDDTLGEAVVATYGAAVYLLSIIGGWLADRMIGARRSVLYGGLIIMAGHLSLAVPGAGFSWLGIALVALGTGLLKPNVSTMVGHLYTDRDPRRDAGFSIFYVSINIGAFFAPFVVAFLRNRWGYHAGFSAAAVGMGIALVLYYLGRKRLDPDSDKAPNPVDETARRRAGLIGLGVVAGVAVLIGLLRVVRGGYAAAVIDTVALLSVAASVTYFVVMFRSKRVTPTERRHLRAYLPMWIAAVLFWMIFEQAATKMATFAARRTDLDSLGFRFEEEWFQSINPITITLLAPLFGLLWLARSGKFPSTPMKFAMGVAIAGISFVLLGIAANYYEGPTAPVWVLGGVFVVQTLGELCLSPVGLSATTVLAPKAFASQAMALWFLSSATGQSIAAQAIRLTEDTPDAQFFTVLGVIAVAFGVVLALLSPWAHRQIADAEPEVAR